MMMKRILYFTYFIFVFQTAIAQNLGGSYTYNFLKLAASPQVSALGGAIVAIQNKDVNMTYQNPALLEPNMQQQLGVNFNFLYGGIKHLQANYTKYNDKLKTTFNASINYINYGKTPQTDASGNIIGNIFANDYTTQISFSRKYLEKWNYGGAVKLIGSNYGNYSSYSAAIDFGVTFTDTIKLIKAGLVFKNIGTQIKAYNSGSSEPLPFDLQLGISKKLEKAPLQFIFTVTNAHQLDIRYADTLFENEINGSVKKGNFTIDKIFRHFIVGAQIYPSKNTELTIAYNYLRRKELTVFNIGNGFTGFSFGAGLLWNAYQFRFAKAFYQNTKAYNQIGITIDFKKLHY